MAPSREQRRQQTDKNKQIAELQRALEEATAKNNALNNHHEDDEDDELVSVDDDDSTTVDPRTNGKLHTKSVVVHINQITRFFVSCVLCLSCAILVGEGRFWSLLQHDC